MADFPAKVNTETSSPQSQSSEHGGISLQRLTANITTIVDMSFIRSIPAYLMMAEIVLGLLHWALITSSPYTLVPVYGWVMFVAVTLWIITTILFLMILFGAQQKLNTVPWPLAVMVYHGIATLLYLTAFLANAASIQPFSITNYYGTMAAAAFFGAVVTVAYGVNAFFSYLDWKGDGGNAATSTVPT
ncbi:plasmolipin [Mastacembelus armatus]|uniref:Plasmolipin n=1 Tax=Mastacembelus armatus TaxID=205130 RepID=A0A3Q3MJS2_9TELE|nr:plasmolipin [Mastacembelus armatus]